MCLSEGGAEGWTCRETWAASSLVKLCAASSLGRVLSSLPLRSDQGPREAQRLSAWASTSCGSGRAKPVASGPAWSPPALSSPLAPWCVLSILEGQPGPWPGQGRDMGTMRVTSSAVHFREQQRTGRPGATPQTGLQPQLSHLLGDPFWWPLGALGGVVVVWTETSLQPSRSLCMMPTWTLPAAGFAAQSARFSLLEEGEVERGSHQEPFQGLAVCLTIDEAVGAGRAARLVGAAAHALVHVGPPRAHPDSWTARLHLGRGLTPIFR